MIRDCNIISNVYFYLMVVFVVGMSLLEMVKINTIKNIGEVIV